MCKYCNHKDVDFAVIGEKNCGVCNIEIFVEQDNSLSFNTYRHETNYTEDILGSFEINFCPMCGRNLKEQ